MKNETNMAYIHWKPHTTIAAAFIFMSFTSHTVANIVGPVNDGSLNAGSPLKQAQNDAVATALASPN